MEQITLQTSTNKTNNLLIIKSNAQEVQWGYWLENHEVKWFKNDDNTIALFKIKLKQNGNN